MTCILLLTVPSMEETLVTGNSSMTQVAFLLGRPTLTASVASVAEVVPAVPAVPSGFATILGNVFRPMTQ